MLRISDLLGRDEGEELVLGLVLVLGRRRRRRRRRRQLDGAGGGEAVLPKLLAHELVVDEGGAPEAGEHEPRDEQQLQLVPNGDPGTDRQTDRVRPKQILRLKS